MTNLKSYQGVALCCPISFGYRRYSRHSTIWFIGRVLQQLLNAAGISKSNLDGLAISSFSLVPDSAITLTQYFDLQLRWIEQFSFGGASGVIAMRRAARAIQSGDADIIACIAADTFSQDSFADLVKNFSSFTQDASYPYGAAGPNAPFSIITENYMQTYGACREDFAQLAISQRYNAKHCQHALLGQQSLTLEDYLTARQIAGPLHLYDCVMPCAGAEGFLMMSTERAQSLNLPYVVILAADELHNAFADDDVQIRAGWDRYRESLYQHANIGPEDINLLQTYDDYPVISLLQIEGLGFCKNGQGKDFLRNTPLTFDGGGLPHNTNGGQLSVGQAGAAGGYLGLVEALRQLNGQAQGRQVNNAKHALVSGYGMINYDRGLCTAATVLARSNA